MKIIEIFDGVVTLRECYGYGFPCADYRTFDGKTYIC